MDEPRCVCELTFDECVALADYIECNLYDVIRGDTFIDNIEWAMNILVAYKKMKEATR